MIRVVFIMIIFSLMVSCAPADEKGIVYIRQHPNEYIATTVPYEETIEFTLTTEEIMNGLTKPMKITSDQQTDVFLVEIKEDTNKINQEKEIALIVGFRYTYHSPEGSMISLFRVNKDNTFSTGLINLSAHNEMGESGDIEVGSGDFSHQDGFEQTVMYRFKEDELKKSKKWNFEINGLYVLNYEEK
ncbi:hypothetical protein [Alkalihalobacillus sp. R86527]|uniref:hypothetical protein n=1 Tax=Alkalihalobacillus sp. R86527 TaxID=3093863 RepID=UPI00366BEE63